MKGCVQRNPVFTVEKILPRSGLKLWTARSVGLRLITHSATRAPLSIRNGVTDQNGNQQIRQGIKEAMIKTHLQPIFSIGNWFLLATLTTLPVKTEMN